MEPIEIIIMEEEEPVVHVAERQPPTLVTAATETSRGIARGARAGWRRLPRRQVEAVTRRGVTSSLRWLSRRLGELAARFSADE